MLPPRVVIDPAPLNQVKPGMEPAAFDGMPTLQLLDRVDGRWVEFSHAPAGVEFTIASPERFVDPSGAFRARFVNRGDQGMTAWFSVGVQLEGTAR